MKRAVKFILGITALILAASCASTGADEKKGAAEDKKAEAEVKKPIMLDYKGRDFDRQVPDWVLDPISKIQENYPDKYAFRYESPRAKSKEGAEMYTKNMKAMAEIAGMIETQVKSKFSGASAGDLDAVETYMEQMTQTLAEANISGLRPEDDFWTYRRYFTPEGDVKEDAYTYYILYVIDKQILDDQVNAAIEGVEPETEEGKRAKDMVRDAWSEGL